MAAKIGSISGFPEYLPEEQIAFNRMIKIIREEYEAAGGVNISTPIIERIETIRDKGIEDKELYFLGRMGHDAEPEHLLRFDLTVPFCRYVAQHRGEITFPFRRYQIQPVWRGERAQKGRYRQFIQADIDIVGDGELSLLNDAEIPYIINEIFTKLDFGPFIINISNRKMLNGVIQSFGLSEDAAIPLIKIIDDCEKKPIAETIDSAKKIGIANNHLKFFEKLISTNFKKLEAVEFLREVDSNELFDQGMEELNIVFDAMQAMGVPETNYCFDPKIVRGLDYYTGTVYETFLQAGKRISVCSGGRYDHLVSKILRDDSAILPGVGISIGVSRLFAQLMDQGIIETDAKTPCDVLVARFDGIDNSFYFSLAGKLRSVGYKTELFTEKKKLGQQLKYASVKGFKYAAIAGEDEISRNVFKLRNMKTGEEREHNITEVKYEG